MARAVARPDGAAGIRKRRTSKSRSAVARRGGANVGTAGDPDTPADRAEALVVAAFALFAERNFASVTIKDIAAAIGVNTALIYYYFGNKEELFRATIEHAVDRAFRQFRAHREALTTPPEIIAGWLENHVRLGDLIRKLVKISLDYASNGRRLASIDRSIRRFYDDEAAAVSDAILGGIEQGLFRPVDPSKLTAFISTHLDGIMVRSAIFPDVDLAAAVADLQALVWAQLDYRP
jgi:TetR/AcrR family transcriptional regulator, upper aerobic nicotinate degradation pathway regulator